jgi:ATP phosphoribosyltransferase regulatory subunit HisZ
VFQPPAITAQQLSSEEGKLRRVEESIRVFVRVADPKYRQIVPMRFFNLTLTQAEADAYSASFLEEKSLRADVARTLIRLVSISARTSTELEELKRSQKMSSLWKLHADSVVVLLDMASTATEDAGSVAKAAEQGGSGAAARTIHESAKKLRTHADIAVKTLANVS